MYTLITCWKTQYGVHQFGTRKAADDMFNASLSVNQKRDTLRALALYNPKGTLVRSWSTR